MHALSAKKLTSRELEKLTSSLEKYGNHMSFPEIHGFFTAIGSSPFLITPSLWLDKVLKEPFDSQEEVTSTHDLLMRFHNQVLRTLKNGKITPLLSCKSCKWSKDVDPQALSQWCSGYMRGSTYYGDLWEEREEDPESEILSLAVFSLLLFVEDKKQALPKQKLKSIQKQEHLEDMKQKVLPTFPVIIQGLYDYWQDTAEDLESAEEDMLHSLPMLGRNDPCFCGSRKKFKKCCLQ